jgi:hypothetical protein
MTLASIWKSQRILSEAVNTSPNQIWPNWEIMGTLQPEQGSDDALSGGTAHG